MRPLRQEMSRRHGQVPEPQGVLDLSSGALPSLTIAQDLANRGQYGLGAPQLSSSTSTEILVLL